MIKWTDKKENEKRSRYSIILGTKGIKTEGIESSLSGNKISVLQNVFDLCILGLINLSNMLLCKVNIRENGYKYMEVQTQSN